MIFCGKTPTNSKTFLCPFTGGYPPHHPGGYQGGGGYPRMPPPPPPPRWGGYRPNYWGCTKATSMSHDQFIDCPILALWRHVEEKRGATNVPNPASFSQVSSRTLHKNMDDFCSWPSLVKRPHSVNDDEGRRNNDFSIDHSNCNNRIIPETNMFE